MVERSEKIEFPGKIELRTTSPEDIFLFKSVTPRKRDREDMATLFYTGIDLKIVYREIKNQKKLLGKDKFITEINESLVGLKEKFGITVPDFLEKIEQLSNKALEKLEIISKIEEKGSKIENIKADTSSENPEELIKELLKEKRIRKKKDTLYKT